MIFTVEMWDDNSLWLIPSHLLQTEAYLDWKTKCSGFAERTWRARTAEGKRGFVVPFTQVSMDYLQATWRRGEDYDFDAEVVVRAAMRKADAKVDLARAEKRWKYLFEGEETTFIYPTLRKPMPQQAIGVECCVGREYFALLMEMGTGKTKIVCDEIGLDSLEIGELEVCKYLIVCPRSLRVNWRREFALSIPAFHNVSVAILKDNPVRAAEELWRITREPSRQKVAICSYDFLRSLLPLLVIWRPDFLACDESHYIKNHRSERWKSVKEMAVIAKRRRLLTGTPVANNLLDLWAQFEILQPGILGYGTMKGFKQRYANCTSIIDPQTNKPTTFDKIEGFKHVEELKERVARCSFIVKKHHCLKFLPKKLYETRRIEMPGAVREQYEELRQTFTLKLEGADAEVNAEFMLAQMTKLAQICCGFVIAEKTEMTPVAFDPDGNACCDEEVVKVTVAIPGGDAKLSEMLDDAEEVVQTGKLIIWARFNYDCDHIVAGLRGRGIGVTLYDGRDSNEARRQACIDSFNTDAGCRVFVSKAGSGGVGLTLLGNQQVDSDRCSTVFFYSNTFNMAHREQAEDRCHRIGQHNPVLYRDYVYEETVEEDIAQALQEKRDLANELKNVSTIKHLLMKGADDRARVHSA